MSETRLGILLFLKRYLSIKLEIRAFVFSNNLSELWRLWSNSMILLLWYKVALILFAGGNARALTSPYCDISVRHVPSTNCQKQHQLLVISDHV